MSPKLLASAVFLAPALAAAQPASPAPVQYQASFENAAHHEARISVTYEDAGDAPVTFRMARSSPGRYAIHEFAKNVYDFSATDSAGNALTVTRDDPYSWTVSGHDGTVTATYTLYADRADGTYSQVDTTHAHLNMPSAFLWAEGFENRPVEITFNPADPDWKIATQLEPTGDPHEFRAPDFQYFMDSPTELSDFDLREWTVEEEAGRYTIRLALHHDGTAQDADEYAQMAQNVTEEQIEMWGDIPDFDYGTYTFIACYLPHVNGDGMEHRNSTILTSSEGLYKAEFDQLGTLSHEFIHAWSVERLRPAELEPFDFTQANPTPSLWFAEGFTSYYAPLFVLRAGESDLAEYLDDLSGTLDYVLNGRGRDIASPEEMSLRAPFVDAATAIDPTNFANNFVSYYPYGAVIGLALDLELRQRFDDVTLDDYMRRMWETHGRAETPYTPADLEAGLAEVTGDAAFAEAFFDQYVEESGLPDLGQLLEQAGLVLRKANEGDASSGPVTLKTDGKAVEIASNAARNSALYAAGLDRGDEILRLGRLDIDSKDDWDDAVSRFEPGDTAEIVFVKRGQERTKTVTFDEDQTLEVVAFEDADRDLTRAQKRFRRAWLGEDTAE